MSAFKTWLTGLTSKSTPVDADELYLRDSVGSASNKLTWANVKATLKTYTDTLYLALTGGTLAGGTRTTSGSTLTITETLNNAGVTFPGALVMDVTDMASGADSLLLSLKVGGASKFTVRKDAVLGAYTGGIGDASGNRTLVTNSQGLAIVQGGRFGWGGAYSGPGGAGGAADLELHRDAANTLAQRNGTNAQTTNRYRSYTNASNYSRVTEKWNTTTAIYHAEGLGTGSDGSVAFNDAELATNATVGFVMLPSCADAPSGTPADIPTGQVPVVFDSASSKIYAYIGGAWKSTPALT